MKEIRDNLEYCSNMFDYTLKPNECEILLTYIKGLEDNIKSLIDLNNKMDKNYEKLECKYFIIKGKIEKIMDNLKCDNCLKEVNDEEI